MNNYTICLNSKIENNEQLNSIYMNRRIYWDWCILSTEIKENVVYKSIDDENYNMQTALNNIFDLITQNTEGNIIANHDEALQVIMYYKKQFWL